MFSHYNAANTPSEGDGGNTTVAYTWVTLVIRYHSFTKFKFKKKNSILANFLHAGNTIFKFTDTS